MAQPFQEQLSATPEEQIVKNVQTEPSSITPIQSGGVKQGAQPKSNVAGNADAGRAAYDAWRKSADDLTARTQAANITSPNDPRLAGFQEEGQKIMAARSAAGSSWDAYSNPNNLDPGGGMRNVIGGAQPSARASGNGGAENSSMPQPAQIGDRTQTGMVGNFTPQTINVPNFNSTSAPGGPAAQVTGAAPITPQTGTANTYNAQTATGSPDVTAGTAGASTATTATSQVNPETDTVAGQITGLIDANSPLMQRAIKLANDRMSRRGLINSSAGINAAQTALYDAATPIATADANTYNTTRLANQTAENQTRQLNAQLMTDVSKFNVDRALQAGIVNKQQADQIAQFNAQQTNQASQFNAASAQDMAKFNIANLLQAGIINQDQANKLSMFNADQVNALNRLREDISGRIATANIGANASIATAQIGANASMSNAALSAQTQQALGQLDATTRTNIANIQAQNQVLLNTNSNAASLYQQNMVNIANIQNNPNLDEGAKATAIANLTGGLANGLNFIGKMGGVDVSGLLNFDTSTANTDSTTNTTNTGTNVTNGTTSTGNGKIDSLLPPVADFRRGLAE